MAKICCVIEGLPGAGKSTLLSNIAPEMAGTALIVPEFVDDVDGDRDDIDYYVENERRKAQLMATGDASVVFCDRYWQSSVIYCAATANARRIAEVSLIRSIVHKEPLFDAYVYVYLKIPCATSLQRAHTPEVPNMWSSPAFCRRALELYDTVFENIETMERGLVGKLCIETSESSDLETRQRLSQDLRKYCSGIGGMSHG